MNHTGVMIAFYPSEKIASLLALEIDGAVPAEELHLTVAYLGDLLDSPDLAKQKNSVVAALSRFANRSERLTGRISGVGRFNNDEGDATNALIALFDSPALPAFRQHLLHELGFVDVHPVMNHGFTPHITLAYINQDEPMANIELPAQTMKFGEIVLVWGDERTRFPLGTWDYHLMESSLHTYKDQDGQHRWIIFSSSAYTDRDEQTVRLKALEEDVERANQDGRYGPLRWWHIGNHDPSGWDHPDGEPWGSGLDLGTCDGNITIGPFLIETGTFKNAQIAQAIGSVADDLGVSIGFHHPANQPDSDGTYHTIKRFERSLLPKGRESNLFTSITVKDKDMSNSELANKAQQLASLLGDEQLTLAIFDEAITKAQSAKAGGMTFKEQAQTEATRTPAPAQPAQPPAPPAPFALEAALKAFGEAFMTQLTEKEAERIKVVEALSEKVTSLEASLKEAQTQLGALQGTQPPALTNGYRASQATDNVINPVEAAIKALSGQGIPMTQAAPVDPRQWAVNLVQSMEGKA